MRGMACAGACRRRKGGASSAEKQWRLSECRMGRQNTSINQSPPLRCSSFDIAMLGGGGVAPSAINGVLVAFKFVRNSNTAYTRDPDPLFKSLKWGCPSLNS